MQSKLVARKMKTAHVRPHRVVEDDKTALGKEVCSHWWNACRKSCVILSPSVAGTCFEASWKGKPIGTVGSVLPWFISLLPSFPTPLPPSLPQELPATLWAQLIHARLQQKDCIDKVIISLFSSLLYPLLILSLPLRVGFWRGFQELENRSEFRSWGVISCHGYNSKLIIGTISKLNTKCLVLCFLVYVVSIGTGLAGKGSDS